MATIESGQLSRGGSWTDGIRQLWAVGAEDTYARAVDADPDDLRSTAYSDEASN
jgi:hypothetical protein